MTDLITLVVHFNFLDCCNSNVEFNFGMMNLLYTVADVLGSTYGGAVHPVQCGSRLLALKFLLVQQTNCKHMLQHC